MSLTRYAAVHESPQGPGDARPTALQVLRDENLDSEQLTGKSIFITGVSSGLGAETAKVLFLTGATLFTTARDLDRAKQALGEEMASSSRVHLLPLDLGSFDSVRACVELFKTRGNTLNIFIANAGIMAAPEGRTRDGFESQFGTNHLGHFLLFTLLRPALLKGAATGFESRAVFVSSVGHRFGEVRLDDYNFETNAYDPWKSYGQSKTANIWTANELDRRYNNRGLRAFSVHPGGVVETTLLKHVSEDAKEAMITDPALKPTLKNTEQGAATTVWAAISKSLDGLGGKYLENVQVAQAWKPEDGPWGRGYAPHAYSPEKESQLWDLSLKLVGAEE
jgi:NAD(P)-dependent dehydrogenase (short-subunit alcohol dehydrogenase family)